MNNQFLFPPQASTLAPEIDAVFWGLIAMSVFFLIIVGGAIVLFAVRYRRKHENEVGQYVPTVKWLEITWTVIPAIMGIGFFVWGSKPFIKSRQIPPNAMEIAVVGKQWMWKFQHPDGKREINDLHVPLGRPIHLKLISQDVIHSLYIPAFRIKQDALPMYYTSIWFEATKVGKFRIFCAEYCGKDHSIMGGWVHVMYPNEYEDWLASQSSAPEEPGRVRENPYPLLPALPASATSLERVGQELFQALNCVNCHITENIANGPSLGGIYETEIEMEDGSKVLVDDNYLRESILNPMAKIVKGYSPVMPAFRGQISEEELSALIAYIKTLRSEP